MTHAILSPRLSFAPSAYTVEETGYRFIEIGASELSFNIAEYLGLIPFLIELFSGVGSFFFVPTTKSSFQARGLIFYRGFL